MTPAPRVDEVCDRFEGAWRAGQEPRIEEYLAPIAAAERTSFLRELLALEVELRRRCGERPEPGEYRRRFPGHDELIADAFAKDPSAAAGARAEAETGAGDARPEGPRRDTARDLLFGILALQNNFVSREALLDAFNSWVADRSRPLAQILRERGGLPATRSALIEALVQEHLDQHGGDAEQTLSSFQLVGAARHTLEKVADPDVQASLSLARTRDRGGRAPEFEIETDVDPEATRDHRSMLPTPAGGRFRILRHHARGGLGAVYAAYDEDLHREVALKEIQPQYADDAESRVRFLIEAEITGSLEHPGIVPVYALGQYADGRPYYAMRFIRGETLKEAAQRFHAEDEPGRNPGERTLALRELLGRFVAVCNAIAYAHSRGVLHRDLKPGNILLGPYGETLVVDWGLAKPVGRSPDSEPIPEGTLRPASASGSSETRQGHALGTPAYMSPEQAAGRLDELGPASDVYSLGATLYAILTGELPFTDDSLTTLLHAVQRGEFPAPRTVNPRVPAALDAICRKAMALRSEDRYASARALAGDIEHWLADEPVLAYREPIAARLARWGRRHRPVVAGVAGLLVAAVVALSIGTLLLERERARKEEQRRLALEQRRLALVNFRLAQEAADDMLTEVGDVDLADIPQMEPVRRRLLEKARHDYEKFLQQRDDDPAIRFGAGRAHARLGDVLEMMGDYAEAERVYRRALELLRAPGADSTPAPAIDRDARRELARVHLGLGLLLKKTNRFRESESAFREAIRLREALVAAAPQDPEARQAQADSRYHLAALRARLAGRKAEDEAVYHEVLERQKALVAENRDRPEYRATLGRYLNNLAMLQGATGHPREAEDSLQEALTSLSALAEASPGVPGPRWQLARSTNNLGALIRNDPSRAAEAEEVFRRAQRLLDALTAEFPRIPQYRLELAAVASNLGQIRWAGGRIAEAITALKRSRDLLEGLTREFPAVPEYQQKLAVAQFNLSLLEGRSDPAAADPLLREALAIQERLVQSNPDVPEYRQALGRSLYSLAYDRFDRGATAEARRHVEAAIGHHQAALATNPENPSYRECLYEDHGLLALACLEGNDPVAAAAALAALPPLLSDDFKQYAHAIALWARCAQAVAGDTRLAAPVRRDLDQSYGERAVGLARTAVKKGLIRHPEQLDRLEFQHLHEREDFRRLREELAGRRSPRVG
jgi:serine/threonine-protein kinase